MRGKPVSDWNAARSREAGIETVFQDRALAVQQIDRAQHLHGPRARRLARLAQIAQARSSEAERLMREIGFTSKVFTPHSIVGQLSGGERQGVAIARAIYNKADLIVLDEPTTALSLTETAKVFHFVRQVRASGRSILFIGHNIHHVFDIADRFVVLDRGKVALRGDARPRSASAEELIDFMEDVAHPGGSGCPAAHAEAGAASMAEIARSRSTPARTQHAAGRPPRARRCGASFSTNRAGARLARRLRRDDGDLHCRQSAVFTNWQHLPVRC